MLSPLALLKAHPKGAAIAGAAGLGGIVLLKRRASTTNAAGQSTDGAAGSATAAGQMGTGVYDSTANDVYSSLEPAIEGLYGQMSQLQDQFAQGIAQLDTTHAPAPVASSGAPHPNVHQPPPAKKTTPKKKKTKKTTAKKTAPARHVPAVHKPAVKSKTRHPAAVTTPKPTAKPPARKTKPKKTPKPKRGAPAPNRPRTLGDLLSFGLPKPKRTPKSRLPRGASL